MVIRRARFGTALVAICLASGAIACGSSSEPESRGQDGPGLELVGFAGERRDVMEAIRAKLDEGSALTRAELTSAVTAPENEDGSPGAPRPDDVWLSLFAGTPEDDVSRTRAVWEASLVLAALWRRLEAQGDHGLRGGSLRFAGAASEGDAVGATQLTYEEIKAIVDEAAKLERKVAAHAHGALWSWFILYAAMPSASHSRTRCGRGAY